MNPPPVLSSNKLHIDRTDVFRIKIIWNKLNKFSASARAPL